MNAIPMPLVCLLLGQLAPPVTLGPPQDLPPAAAPGVSGAAAPPPGDAALPQEPKESPGSPPPLQWQPVAPSGLRSLSSNPSSSGDTERPAGVVPASGESPPASAKSKETLSRAEALLQQALGSADATPLDAEKTSLLQAIRHTAGAGDRLQAVRTYWRLVASIAVHRLAEQEEVVLRDAVEPPLPHERALLAAARSATSARRQQAQLTIAGLQWELAEQFQPSVTANLPWPTDVPLIGPYRTGHEVRFRELPAPLHLQRIDRMLPVSLKTIERQSAALFAAQEALGEVARAYHQGQAPLKLLLEAVAQLRAEREAFLSAVVYYNHQIAEYALAVIGPAADPATVVSTLIKPASSTTATGQRREEIRQTSAEEPAGGAEVPPSPFRDLGSPPPAATPSAPQETGAAGESRSILRSVRVAH